MYCQNCGTEISNDAKFCPNCGHEVVGINGNNSVGMNNQNYDNRQWYYYKGKDKMGPVSFDDMEEYIRRGSVDRKTLVWATGFDDWVRAEETELWNFLQNIVPDVPGDEISEKWIWAIATVPLLLSIILPPFFVGLGVNTFFATLIVFIANVAFLSLDTKELKNAGKDAGAWMFLGLILIPVYIFVRESKTNKNYTPGIVWCVIFVLVLIL